MLLARTLIFFQAHTNSLKQHRHSDTTSHAENCTGFQKILLEPILSFPFEILVCTQFLKQRRSTLEKKDSLVVSDEVNDLSEEAERDPGQPQDETGSDQLTSLAHRGLRDRRGRRVRVQVAADRCQVVGARATVLPEVQILKGER